MRSPRRLIATVLATVGFLIAGCGDSGTTSSSNSASGPTESSSDGDASTTTTTRSPVTAPPTTAPDPTIFNPSRIGNPFDLASFVLTVDEFHSYNGSPTVRTTTYGYIKDPHSAFAVEDFGDSTSKEYFVDGATLQLDNQGYWYLFANGDLAAPDILQRVRESNAMYGVTTAVFVAEEPFDGIPAYHFTFDETNLASYTPGDTGTDAEGDFFLAKDGNKVLYAHQRMVSSGPGYELIDEYTETLSSVNALAEITLPDDMVPLKEALDTGTLLGIPMPADGVVDSMINYNQGGIGVYYYQFTSSWTNEAQFIDFYTNLQPTNGWTVTWIGQVKNLDAYCADGNCVIIKNGDKQVILYFDGSHLHADWDREHQFKPCTNPYSAEACG